jgi:FAD/FMN-containing dehydrogenase
MPEIARGRQEAGTWHHELMSGADYPAGFVDDLAAIVGETGLRHADAVRELDPGIHPGNLQADLMVRPTSTAEVAAVLKACNGHRIAVVPQGGRTGLAGGAVSRPGQLILALDRMRSILELNPVARTATVEAGVTLEQLQQAVVPFGLAPGIDLGARGSATIGGMVSTNAGGMDAFRHGTMRQRVLGLEAVSADGRVVDELRRVRKNNSGLPLWQLFIGSEGTLGVVTRVVVDLVPAPAGRRTALVLVPDLGAAISLLRDAENLPWANLAAAELMSGNHMALTARALGIAQVAAAPPAPFALLLAIGEAGGAASNDALEGFLAEASEAGRIIEVFLPKNDSEERDLWRMREDWAVDRAYVGGLWYDVSVPLDALAGYLAALRERLRKHDPALDLYVVGHLGDGNVHITVNATMPIHERYDEIEPLVYEGLRAIGGSFSAEHGIGLEKRAALERWAGADVIALMRAIKAVFDPNGIMNPGKVL